MGGLLQDSLASDVEKFMISKRLELDDASDSKQLFKQIVMMMCKEITFAVYQDPTDVAQGKPWHALLQDLITQLLVRRQISPADVTQEVENGIDILRYAFQREVINEVRRPVDNPANCDEASGQVIIGMSPIT